MADISGMTAPEIARHRSASTQELLPPSPEPPAQPPHQTATSRAIDAMSNVSTNAVNAAMGVSSPLIGNKIQMGAAGIVFFMVLFYMYTGREDQRADAKIQQATIQQLLTQSTVERVEQRAEMKTLIESTNQNMRSMSDSIERLRNDQLRAMTEQSTALRQLTDELRKKMNP